MANKHRRGKDKERIFISSAQRIISTELQQSLAITAEQAEEVARQAVHGICKHFAKQMVYISSDREFDLTARDLELWTRFNGRNHEDLAMHFNLSVVQIYKIVNFMRDEQKKRREPMLPGFDF